MINTTRPQNIEEQPGAIPIRPLVRLARCSSVEDTLNHLAGIIREEGINLCAIRHERAGYSREFRPPDPPIETGDVNELEARVEGGKTRLTVVFYGQVNSRMRCEIEDATHMAAQRIELLCERSLWADKKVDAGRSSSRVGGMVGDSEPMQLLKRRIVMAAGCSSTILINGESGTGKELAARAIHGLSSRAAGPFIAVNCGAFAEALLESELFGYLKGAFTGAVTNRKGLFEAAHKGTIFLDEIGETAPAVQLRLLRVLQERKVRPVGSYEERDVDVRIIAATNKDLCREVEEKRFRHDLFYRLHILPLVTPPLRRRAADIPLLTGHFLRVIQGRLGFGSGVGIEDDAVHALGSYHWPGNVRELEAVLERMAVEAGDGGVITAEQVRRETSTAQSRVAARGEIEYVGMLRAGESLHVHLSRQESILYEMVRTHFGGNHSQAARWLGMERTALYHRVERARRRTVTSGVSPY